MNQKQITLLLVFHDPVRESDRQYISTLTDLFQQVIMFTRKDPEIRFKGVQNILYKDDGGLVSALNKACRSAVNEWVFLLESDEIIKEAELQKVELNPAECFPAFLSGEFEQKDQWYYDLRLLPLKTGQEIFKGTVIPDPSDYVLSNGLKISEQMIVIEKSGSFIRLEKLKSVVDLQTVNSDMDWYWKGIYYSEIQRFPKAEKCFRYALRNESLLDFYQLSALNGLANVLLNQNKMDEALLVVERSAKLDNRQFAPFLIRHKIHWMRGEWEQAYSALHNYLVQLQQNSRANLDFFLDPAEAHFLMAEISMLMKDRRHAFHHLDLFYDLNDGNVSDDVKDKLFVYAVELNEQEKALEYLKVLFSQHLTEGLEAPVNEEEQIGRILGSISLLEEKGWHQTACEMYEKLFCVNPENQKIMRRWLISLLKSNQLKRAQKVAEILKKNLPATLPHQEIQFS